MRYDDPGMTYGDPEDLTPFTRSEALVAGVSVDAWAGPRYQRLFHGLYRAAGV